MKHEPILKGPAPRRSWKREDKPVNQRGAKNKYSCNGSPAVGGKRATKKWVRTQSEGAKKESITDKGESSKSKGTITKEISPTKSNLTVKEQRRPSTIQITGNKTHLEKNTKHKWVRPRTPEKTSRDSHMAIAKDFRNNDGPHKNGGFETSSKWVRPRLDQNEKSNEPRKVEAFHSKTKGNFCRTVEESDEKNHSQEKVGPPSSSKDSSLLLARCQRVPTLSGPAKNSWKRPRPHQTLPSPSQQHAVQNNHPFTWKRASQSSDEGPFDPDTVLVANGGCGLKRNLVSDFCPKVKRVKLDCPVKTCHEKEKRKQNDDDQPLLTDFAYREVRKHRNSRYGNAKERNMGLVRVKPNENKTPICPVFLRGIPCLDERCTKRHDVPKEAAMPICSFFQRNGLCLKGETCPFRHVKVNLNNGRVCPTFRQLGFCNNKDCVLPHVRPSLRSKKTNGTI